MAVTKSTKGSSSVPTKSGDESLIVAIRQIWESARSKAARSVNSALVQANWLIGQRIVEAEQGGKSRADYSRRLLKTLSEALEKDFGNGFSVSALQYMRAFYLGYPGLLKIQHAVRVELTAATATSNSHAPSDPFAMPGEADWQPGRLHSGLSWTGKNRGGDHGEEA